MHQINKRSTPFRIPTPDGEGTPSRVEVGQAPQKLARRRRYNLHQSCPRPWCPNSFVDSSTTPGTTTPLFVTAVPMRRPTSPGVARPRYLHEGRPYTDDPQSPSASPTPIGGPPRDLVAAGTRGLHPVGGPPRSLLRSYGLRSADGEPLRKDQGFFVRVLSCRPCPRGRPGLTRTRGTGVATTK